jgi:hypothetical protein
MHDRPLERFSGDNNFDAAGRQAITDTPELYMLDVNPKSVKEKEKIDRAIAGANKTTVLDSVFQRTFLNVQFPVQGSVDSSINTPLKEKWHNLTIRLLHLSGESFTKNGQRVGARVGEEAIRFFVTPFAAQHIGHRGYEERLVNLVSSTLEGGYEQLIQDFVEKKCGLLINQ